MNDLMGLFKCSARFAMLCFDDDYSEIEVNNDNTELEQIKVMRQR